MTVCLVKLNAAHRPMYLAWPKKRFVWAKGFVFAISMLALLLSVRHSSKGDLRTKEGKKGRPSHRAFFCCPMTGHPEKVMRGGRISRNVNPRVSTLVCCVQYGDGTGDLA